MDKKIKFVNGKSECGCIMEFSDGHGEFSDVHTITLCQEHDPSKRPSRRVLTEDEVLRRMQSRIDGTTKFGEPFN